MSLRQVILTSRFGAPRIRYDLGDQGLPGKSGAKFEDLQMAGFPGFPRRDAGCVTRM
jgi:hypothetical protein